MDLKVYKNNKIYFLVIVDLATRFCSACVIGNKLPKTIIKGLFVCWIIIFGPPNSILTDNGGEFSNPDMRSLGEAFNINLKTTAGERPWSNGVCERLNGVLANLVLKVIDDTGCDVQTALAWAVAARNAFHNHSGFSPNQLVFGFNPNTPDVYNSTLPGLASASPSEIVQRNLTAKAAAREMFIRFEASE